MSTSSRDYYRQVASKYFAPAPIPTRTAPVAPVQQVAPAQEEKKDEGGGFIDSVFGGIGKTVEAAGDVLDLSGKYMSRPILGALSKGIASNTVQNALGSVGIESLSEEDAERIRNAESYTQAWRERAKVKGTDWWEEMLAEVIADPTTYVTAGGVGAIRALPWVADAAKASPALSRALQQAEHVVGLAERAQALPLTAPLAGIRKAASKTDLLKPTAKSNLVEDIEAVDAAARSALSQGMRTTAGTQPGEFGPDQLIGSGRVRDAQELAKTINPVGPRAPGSSTMASQVHSLNNTQLADLYKVLGVGDPLRAEVERVMKNKGLLNQTTIKNAAGTSTINSLNQPALTRSEEARQRFLNTPGNQGAMPQNVAGDVDATYENVMRFARHKAGLNIATPTANEPFVKTAVMGMLERNKEFTDAPALWAHPEVQEDLVRAISAPNQKEAATHLATAFDRINAKQSARGLIHPWGLRVLDRYLPDIQKTEDVLTLPAFNRYGEYGSVISDKEMKALRRMQSDHKVVEAQKAWEKDRAAIGSIFDNTPGAQSLSDTTTANDIKNMMHLFTPEDARKVDTFLKKWNLHEDTFKGAKSYKSRLAKTPGERAIDNYTLGNAWTDSMVETWAKSEAARMGINTKVDPSIIGKLGWVPRAWREQALISPRYHFVNALDMGMKSMLYGVNPVESRGAKKTAEGLGMTSLPRAVFVGDETIDLAQLSRPDEFMSVGQKSALPGPLGAVSKFNRALARGTENTFREWAWENGLMDTLHQFKPMLHQQIRNTKMPGAENLIKDLEQMGTGVTVGGKKVFTKRDNGVLFSPDQLRGLAQKHGASTEQASMFARSWADAVGQGSQNGINMSNKVHFDFDKTYNIEDKLFLKKWMPFHFFATRNIPFYMETLANRPELVNAWMAYNDLSEQDQIEMGLPARMKGMIPVGDGFLDTILGPGKVFFNPMSALSFVDQTKNVGLATEGSEFQEPAKLMSRKGIGGLIDRASDLGLGGPAPWVQIPLSIVGFTSKGAKDETMPLLRHSGLTENFLGTDLGEGVVRSGINEARAAFHNGERVETHTGSQFRDNQIVTKLQETMQTLIDQGLDPVKAREAFTQASKDGPGSILWDKAAEDVRQDEQARQARGFLFPFPAKDISEKGLELHQAREAAPEGALDNDAVVDLLKHFGDPSVANRGFRRPSLVDRQGEPIFVNRETGQREEQKDQADIWGGNNWGPDRKYPYNSPTIFRMYQQWKQTAPEGARIGDFFDAVPIPGR